MAPSPLSVCVYCGSRDGARPAYAEAAEALGAEIARHGWRLVYGAGDVGMMGRVARSAQAAGGETFGVIPEHLRAAEKGKTDLTNFIVTETMHERKKVMIMNAQAVVVLPGGAGSLDELFEALTWRQIRLHSKPVFILNTEGYWDKLIELIHHLVSEGFAGDDLLGYFTVAETVPELITALEDCAG